MRLLREKVKGEEGLGQNLKELKHLRLGRGELAKEVTTARKVGGKPGEFTVTESKRRKFSSRTL